MGKSGPRVGFFTGGLILAGGLVSSPSAIGGATPAKLCARLYGDAASGPGPFVAGRESEEAVLSGEASSAYNTARRQLAKQFSTDSGTAAETARNLKAKGLGAYGGAGPSLLALDVLGKTHPALFVDAAEGIFRAPLPRSLTGNAAKLANFKVQFGSRLLGQLAVFPAEEAGRLADLMARSPWVRDFVAGQPNAARTLLNFKKSLGGEVPTGATGAKQVAALRVLADAWIDPRRAEALAGKYTMSNLPETDWAFALTLAREMARYLEKNEPAAAAVYAAKVRELGRANVPATFRENPRVADLFREFAIQD